MSQNATESKRFEAGDVTYVSHGSSSKNRCSGGIATVISATERTFTQQCKCGAQFQCMQTDNYPNKTQGRRWESYHEA